jgi:hypothetical protein
VHESGYDQVVLDHLYWLVFRLGLECLQSRGFDWETGLGCVERGSNFPVGAAMVSDHHLWNLQTMIYLLVFVYLHL